MSRFLVVAPHPDDETIGCGGTLLRRGTEGNELAWVVMTEMTAEAGFSDEVMAARDEELAKVADAYGFHMVRRLGFPAAKLDLVPLDDLVAALADVFREFEPEELLLPWRGDVHSDHRVTFDAAASASKAFRLPSVRRWLAYETLSETDATLRPGVLFAPNVFVDITPQLDRKIEILHTYASEVHPAPFPRSAEAVRALTTVRGAAVGVDAAEGFTLLRERS